MRRGALGCWITLALLLAGRLCAQPEPALVRDGARAVLSLDGEWGVLPVAGLALSYPPAADGWQKEAVPHEASRFIETPNGPYMPAIADLLDKAGTGLARKDKLAAWYRRRFTVAAADLTGKRAVLVLRGAAFRSTAWLNGKELGTSYQCAVPIEYNVSAALRPGENELLIGLTGREGILDIAHKCFVTPCNGMMAGLWGSVELQLCPPTQIDDVFVRTSVKNKRLELDVSVANTTATPLAGRLAAVVLDRDGTPQCSLPPVPIAVPAGQTGKVTLTKDWLAPRLWSPESPALYTVRVVLLNGDAPVDSTVTRFGFREFEVHDRDFLLNGRRIVLVRNSTLTAIGNRDAAFPEIRSTVTRPYNCVRLHLGQTNVAELDACDQFGMMAIPEASFSWVDRYPSEAKQVWLANTLEYYRRWIRLHRNRPSVILWSLCNETYWDSRQPADMAVADQILAAVRETDSTRPLQGDGETSWDGRLPTTNIHYPEGEAGEVRQRFPNSGLVVPNDLWWLKPDGPNSGWRANFKWDRPLMLGEYWLMEGPPEGHSSFMGDAVYDWERWRYPASPRQIGETDDMAALQKATDYYRMAGVACLNPWAGNRELFLRPIDVRPIDYHPNFRAGQTTARRTVVFNDTANSYWNLHLECRLAAGEQTLWTGTVPCDAPAGGSKTCDVPVACPAVTVSTPARLLVRLVEGHGWELGRYEETIYLVPTASLAGVGPGGIVLLDSVGRTRQALAGLGLNLPAVATLTTAALAQAKLLLVGEETDASPFAEPIRAWAAEGGRVVVLRQQSGRSLAGELPDTDPQHAAAMSWVRSPEHPVLAGLAEGQMRWWRPDHLVSQGTFHKPATGRFQVLLDCGGRYGMEWTPLAEVRVGRGLYLATQLCLADRVEAEPLAGELLSRLVRYGLTAAPAQPRPMRLLAGGNAALAKTLAACGVVTQAGPAGDGPVLVDGSQALDAAAIASLKQQLASGGTVWLHRFTPESLARVASLFPAAPRLTAFDNTTQTGAIRPTHPWVAGLSTFDLYWSRIDTGFRGDPFQHGQVTAKLGEFTWQLPSPEAGQVLTAPAFLARVPVGRGAVLLDNLAWEDAYGAETAKVSRLASTLVTNLGGDVRLAAERSFDYFSVDLAPHVNMGYYDPVEGDGKGGWTDQGQNDMRFFLINHTGRAGGIEGAAEVGSEPWPAEVRFAGRPFRLVDPTRGEHKGVIALRGGEHDPFLPGEVKGIRVGHTAERLWFLHTACWAVSDRVNAEIGRYVIHYEDGSTVTVPLRYGLELQDWWDPAPLSGSQVAWTGRNLKHSPIGIWVTPWENPSPDKPIATIDLVGNLTQSQIVLLGITGGNGQGGAAERLQARWLPADAAAGTVVNRVPGGPALSLSKEPPTPFAAEGHAGLRFAGGRSLGGESKTLPALVSGGPFSLEMSLMVEKPPVGYMGGLFECMRYQQAGFRLVYYQSMKLGVEIYPGPGKSAYITGQTALQPGRFYRVKLVFDGQRAQLLLDGKLDASVETAPPAPCDGGLRIGSAAGNQYDLNGVVEEVALRAPAH